MGMCPDGNCPECQASRAKFAKEYAPMFREMARLKKEDALSNFMAKVDVVARHDDATRRLQWLEQFK